MADENLLGLIARIEKEIGFVALQGRLMAESRYELERVLREWSDAGVNRIVISLEELLYLDSAGLSTLIGGLHRARRAGGDLVICDLNPRLRSMFEITSIGNYVNVFPREADAVAHFRGKEGAKKKAAAKTEAKSERAKPSSPSSRSGAPKSSPRTKGRSSSKGAGKH